MRTISIIHPSRSRVSQARDTINRWLSRADNPKAIEYILSVDSDDTYISSYSAFQYDIATPFKLIIKDNTTAIQAINYAATKSTGDIIIVCSDDFDCPLHWDTLLSEALEGKEDFVVKTQDGIQPWIITLPILDRIYYNRFGYVYPPHIVHLFSDTWMTHVADLTGRKITLPILFEHCHYTTGKTAKDAINVKNDATWPQGEQAYLDGVKSNFGLLPEEIKGTLQADETFFNWLRKKGIKI